MMTNPNFSKLSNGQIDALITEHIYKQKRSLISYSENMEDAWRLHEKLIGQGTQRLTVNVRGRYYHYKCGYKGVVGTATESTAERAICIAILKALKIIPGGISLIEGEGE